MQFRQYGNTNIQVTAIGLGTWVMGGTSWGGSDKDDCKKTIFAALDSGINLIDTAPAYGRGTSESIVGEAVKEYGRSKVILSTKAGLRWEDGVVGVTRNCSRESLEYELNASLERLQTEYVDIYHLHWPDFSTPMDEVMRSMEKMRKDGKIRAIAVSNLSVEQLQECVDTGLLDGCQPPLNMFERASQKDILPLCARNDLGVMTYGAICRGLLSGKFDKSSTFQSTDLRSKDPKFKPENFGQYLNAIEELKAIADNMGVRLSQLAVAWAYQQEGVTTALVGARRPDQIQETAKAGEISLGKGTMEDIEDILARNILEAHGIEFFAP